MKKALYLAALSMVAALIGSGIARAFPAPALRMAQPLTMDGTQYVAQVYFAGGYGAIAFDSKKSMEQFARLPGVEVMRKAAPIRTARSEVVVEAEE